MDTSVGERIKHVRGQRTQADFADSLGVHKNSLSRYERGSSCPDTDFIAALCTKYGVSVSWLVLGQGSMDAEKGLVDASPDVSVESCARCSTLEAELRREREVLRDISTDNRDLVRENRELWKENGELKVRVGELNVQVVKLEGELDTARTMAKEYHEELKAARAAPEEKNSDDLRHSA